MVQLVCSLFFTVCVGKTLSSCSVFYLCHSMSMDWISSLLNVATTLQTNICMRCKNKLLLYQGLKSRAHFKIYLYCTQILTFKLCLTFILNLCWVFTTSSNYCQLSELMKISYFTLLVWSNINLQNVSFICKPPSSWAVL